MYEHLKTTAGLATCIYDYYEQRLDDVPTNNTTLEEDNLMMTCIDITGIQKFIYDIANKKAAKSLKGRSFFLQLFMQNIIDRISDHPDIQIYHSNVIYASGGKAYLIMPNIERVQKGLTQIEHDVQEYVWSEHQGKIYAVFGCVKFGYRTIFDEVKKNFDNYVYSSDLNAKEKKTLYIVNEKLDLGDLWRIVSDRASAQKNRKFQMKVMDYSIFEPENIDFKLNKCQVTGVRGKELVDLNDNTDPDEDKKLWVLKSVYDQSKLGSKLKDGNYLISLLNSSQKGDISIGNYTYKIVNADEVKKVSGDNDKATVYVLNSTDSIGKLDNVGIKTLLYGGNKQPENIDGSFRNFEDLAKTDHSDNTKLAILRMDVDNLGQIFIKGFDNTVQKKSFAAYATLSFMLEAFFCGHINHIHQSDDTFKNFVQILYSGGDDLFAVGRWDAIIDFAAKVRSEFTRFVGRDDITISGGIAIVGAKYPIMKSAELSGDAEKKAKEFNDNAKNAINFFGETVSWHKEYSEVLKLKNGFVKLKVNSAFLHKIQEFKLSKDMYFSNKIKAPSYKWNAAYYTTKIKENSKDLLMKNMFNEIQKNLFVSSNNFVADRYLDLVAVACRWAEFENKIIN